MEKANRESGIDLFKIVLSLNIIVLHFNNPLYGGGYSAAAGVNKMILLVFEVVSAAAVDGFVIVTGYFLSEHMKRTFMKPLELIVQTAIFNGAFYSFSGVRNADWHWQGFFYSLIPASYFVILYTALYLISPLINRAFVGIKKYRLVLILLFLLFGVEPYVVEIMKCFSENEFWGLSFIGANSATPGYTIVSFMLMYIIGGSLRRFDDCLSKIRFKTLLLCSFAIVVLEVFYARYVDWDISLCYINPLVIAEAVLFFMMFKKIKLKSKVVSKLSRAVFTVYLLNIPLVIHFDSAKIVHGSPVIMVVKLWGVCILIFIVCFLIHVFYESISKCILWRWIDGNKFKYDMYS